MVVLRDFGFLQFTAKDDSIEIASTSEELFFPFGKFKTPPKGYRHEFRKAKIYGNDAITDSVLHVYSDEFSAYFIFEAEDSLYHVYSCSLHGRGPSILGDVSVGMSSMEFLKKWFRVTGQPRIKCIRMETGLTGAIYTLEVADGFIKTITISTYYKIEVL